MTMPQSGDVAVFWDYGAFRIIQAGLPILSGLTLVVFSRELPGAG
jgi:hypothetical protein